MKRHVVIILYLLSVILLFQQCSAPKEKTQVPEESSDVSEEFQSKTEARFSQNKLLESELFETAKQFVKGDTVRKKGHRIIGGDLAFASQIPWQVALIVNGSLPMEGQFCGGSLIHEKWVLTAAHCLENIQPNFIQIFTGSVNLNSGGQSSNVSRIIIHPNYNKETFDNDIALIELSTPVNLTEDQNIIDLPINDVTEELIQPDLSVTVSGWGITETGESSTSLRKVEVGMISNNNCFSSYGNFLTVNMICAGLKAGGKDACQGDSGGPLFIFDQEDNPFLIGIVSWGDGCAEPELYGVYTKVHNYVDWVSQQCSCLIPV